LIVVEVEVLEGRFGGNPLCEFMLVAESRLERARNLEREGVKSPGFPVIGSERNVPIEVDEPVRSGNESGLFLDLATNGRRKVRIARLDLPAHGHPNLPARRGSPKEEKLERRKREEVAFDALFRNRTQRVGH